MIDLLAGIPLWVVFVPITMVIAYFKGRRLVLWGVLGYLAGPLAIVIVLVLSKLPRKEYAWLDAITSRWASKEIEKKFEGLGTTEDFLKEIDNDKKDEK
jgi:hypothetical protein